MRDAKRALVQPTCFLLTIAHDYPDSLWLQYDWKKSPDHLLFYACKRLDPRRVAPVVGLRSRASVQRFRSFDYLVSDGPDFVSERFANLLRRLASSDVQLIEATVRQGGKSIGKLYVPNMLHHIDFIDRRRSVVEDEDENIGTTYRKICYKPGSLGKHAIAKDSDSLHGNILVSETLARACREQNLLGFGLHPEPYIDPLYA
jgi:hypothetical protein